ncbi:helix-turn-helix transcriptional regulator [Parvibaculum sp.]|uniref:helix-turn-helix domain-containing protein n=2 Tax=Parvibaculum sp. TaxID=2024848 RepID=UPI00329952B9
MHRPPIVLMEIRRRLGLNVQRLRRDKGWSQEEFAFECGLHRTYVSGIERGVRNPTVTILEKIAKALGVSPGTLLENAPKRK